MNELYIQPLTVIHLSRSINIYIFLHKLQYLFSKSRKFLTKGENLVTFVSKRIWTTKTFHYQSNDLFRCCVSEIEIEFLKILNCWQWNSSLLKTINWETESEEQAMIIWIKENNIYLQHLLEQLIYFNSMSTHLGLSYAKRLKNCIHYMFIFIFFVKLFKSFCTQLYDIKYS